jgi:LPXTG-motif cell wall-anchored protein
VNPLVSPTRSSQVLPHTGAGVGELVLLAVLLALLGLLVRSSKWRDHWSASEQTDFREFWNRDEEI